MNRTFNLYSRYYDLLYSSKNYIVETEYLVRCLRATLKEKNKVLEFGCGTGKHGALLKSQGYDVYGVDRSHEMIKLAKQNGIDCEVADITSVSLDAKFDCVLALFHVISYLTTNSELVAAFTRANEHLHDDGYFLFDIWYSPAVYNLYPEARVRKVENDELSVVRFAEPRIHCNRNVVDVEYTVIIKDKISEEYTELREVHSMRHFSLPEVELLAHATGFTIFKAEEYLTGKSPSEHTWGVNFILKKERNLFQ